MLTSPIQFFPLFLCSKSPLHHLFKIGKANRTQKLLIIYVFPVIKCVWDFLVSVIVISSDSWFQYRYLCLSFKHPPPFFFCTVPRSKSWLWMCQELSNKLSVYWIKLLRNQYLYVWREFGCVILSGSDSPEPCLCTSLPKEKNQVGGTHVSFVYQSARPQTRLLLTGKTNFLFIPRDSLAAFRCKSPSPNLLSPSWTPSPLIPVWNGFLPDEDNPALAVYSLGYLRGLCIVHNRLGCLYLFLPECT